MTPLPSRIQSMQETILASLPSTVFPHHYTDVRAALPGLNQGLFTTGWC